MGAVAGSLTSDEVDERFAEYRNSHAVAPKADEE